MRALILSILLLAVTAVVVAPPDGTAAPRPAPAFTLTLLDGKTLSLADLKGSAAILLFWAPW